MKYLQKNICYFRIISFSLSIFLAETVMYFILIHLSMSECWLMLPLIIYVLLTLVGKYVNRIKIISVSLELTSILSFLLLCMSIRMPWLGALIEKHFETLAIVIIIMHFINLAESHLKIKENDAEGKDICGSVQLFNLFYLNTSKAHEIAMLIDNKIMKTIEREQVSEELLKYNASGVLGRREAASIDIGYALEDSTKKRVYENFDVKTTKSIMLRKIYETVQKKKEDIANFREGDLALFKDIELRQMNVDDTVMILNILQDSKMNNQVNQDLEINLSKMMDKMLDDFTIDYIFTFKGNNMEEEPFVIKIPYKAKENFENGYQHNDLQLGKLSLIGIYRGKIDFSKRDSMSSKFLEIITDSYNLQNKEKTDIAEMKLSSCSTRTSAVQLDFHHRKLTEEMHLIDVIAIIQELNLNKDE